MAANSTRKTEGAARGSTSRFVLLATRCLAGPVLLPLLWWFLDAQHAVGAAAEPVADAGAAAQLLHLLMQGASDALTLMQKSLPDPLEQQIAWWSLSAGAAEEQLLQLPCQQPQLDAAAGARSTLADAGFPSEIRVKTWQPNWLPLGVGSLHSAVVRTASPLHLEVLWLAVLLRRRVLVLASQKESIEALTGLVYGVAGFRSPPLGGGHAMSAVQPLVSLVDTAWTSTPGLVAGSNNPLLRSKPAWWDICFELSSGSLLISEPSEDGTRHRLRPFSQALPAHWPTGTISPPDKHAGGLLRSRLAATSRLVWVAARSGASAHWVHVTCCSMSREVLQAARLSKAGQPPEGFWSQATARSDATLAGVFEEGIVSEACSVEKAAWQGHASAAPGVDTLLNALRPVQDRCQEKRTKDPAAVGAAVHALYSFVQEPSDALLLLHCCPHSAGGLRPIAAYLLHQDASIRRAACGILLAVETLLPDVGAACVQALPLVMRAALQRAKSRRGAVESALPHP